VSAVAAAQEMHAGDILERESKSPEFHPFNFVEAAR
jgi:hypothetical protein